MDWLTMLGIVGGVATVVGTAIAVLEFAQRHWVRRSAEIQPVQPNLSSASENAAGSPVRLPQDLTKRGPVQSPPESPPACFTGRVKERSKIHELLAQDDRSICIAVQGTGGIGKTALALQVAFEEGDRFSGGRLWARLGQHADIQGILGRWAEASGADASQLPPKLEDAAERVRGLLAGRGRLLAVLDDVWEFDGARLLLQQALPGEAAVLITTRNLQLARRLGCQLVSVGVLPVDDAIAMLDRICGALGSYEVSARQIVALVGGWPIALRVLAARVAHPADLAEMAQELQSGSKLRLLKLDGADTPAESVENTFALSYQPLAPSLQRRFRSLGVFAASPFTVPAAAAVNGDPSNEAGLKRAEDELRALSFQELLTREPEKLWSQHDLLRLYALALLQAHGEEAQARRRHMQHYHELLQHADWPAVELAFAQVRQGWEHAVALGSETQQDYFTAIKDHLLLRRWREYLEWSNLLLQTARDTGNRRLEGELLSERGYVLWKGADYDTALASLQAALPLLREGGARLAEGSCLNRLGLVMREQGHWDEGRVFFERALAINRETGNTVGEGFCRHNIGLQEFREGRFSKAEEDLAGSLDIFERLLSEKRGVDPRTLGEAKEGLAQVLITLGRVYFLTGRKSEAEQVWQRSRLRASDNGDHAGVARALYSLGRGRAGEGDFGKALTLFEEALATAENVGHARLECRSLAGVGVMNCFLERQAPALEACLRSVARSKKAGSVDEEIFARLSLGYVQVEAGAHAEAATEFKIALDLARAHEDRRSAGLALLYLARALKGLGRREEAEQVHAEAAALFSVLQTPVPEQELPLSY